MSSSTSRVHTNMAKKELIQKTKKGIGSGSSATIGAPIVIKCEKKLTIPKTVATKLVGKSRAIDTYPILNDIDPPTLLIHTRIGIIYSFSEV